jgi:hypothetical protein
MSAGPAEPRASAGGSGTSARNSLLGINHRRSLGLLLIAIAGAGCASAPASTIPASTLPPDRAYLPNWPWTFPTGCAVGEAPAPSPGANGCVITGHGIEGRLGAAQGCLWIVLDGSGERKTLRWPSGYSAQLDPLIVFDSQGLEVARGGEEVTADGTEAAGVDAGACGDVVLDVYRIQPSN